MRGLPSRAGNRPSRRIDDDARFRTLWLANVRTADIAAAFGATRTAACLRAKQLGLPPRSRAVGQGGHSGWGTIPLATFLEAELGRRMQEAA